MIEFRIRQLPPGDFSGRLLVSPYTGTISSAVLLEGGWYIRGGEHAYAYRRETRDPTEVALLWRDGSNLFVSGWRVQCLDWLLQHGWLVTFADPEHHSAPNTITGRHAGQLIQWQRDCPAAEFCARAIHEITK